MPTTRRCIATFVCLVFALSLVPYLLVIHVKQLEVGGGTGVVLLMWMPALAAFLSCRILRIDVATLGWNWRPAWSELLGYVLPVLYAMPVYIACWLAIPHSLNFAHFTSVTGTLFGFPHSPRAATFLVGLPVLSTVGVILSLSHALGEEIGWRGFLLPRLVSQFGGKLGPLVSGAIWAVWHYPILLFADYNSGTPKLFALFCFTLMVIAVAYQLAWLRLRSGSLWPCAMLHASHNLFIQSIFDRLTAPAGKALYVTTEFGFGLVLTTSLTAFLLYRTTPALPAKA